MLKSSRTFPKADFYSYHFQLQPSTDINTFFIQPLCTLSCHLNFFHRLHIQEACLTHSVICAISVSPERISRTHSIHSFVVLSFIGWESRPVENRGLEQQDVCVFEFTSCDSFVG